MRSVSCVRSIIALVAIVLGTHSAATPAGAQPMVGLGYLHPGDSSAATAVSADGFTAVGINASFTGGEAFAWTVDTGMVGLGSLPGDPYHYSYASGVARDGSTIVGYAYNALGNGEAFAWTPAKGMVGLGYLPGGPYHYSYATGVSGDGTTIVGYAYNALGNLEAFVWTTATGMIGLGTLPGSTASLASAISSDGTTIVGLGENLQTNSNEAWIWTAAHGMVSLGHLPGALPPSWGTAPSSEAAGVSGDGSTVVGKSTNSQGHSEAFVWTPANGMVGLGYIPGSTNEYSSALGVSGDGSTIVGRCYNARNGDEAFVWTASRGMVGLGGLQSDFGWSIAVGISADGFKAVGTNSYAGETEAFIVDLHPDPAGLILALIKKVKELNLPYGMENSLVSKLDAALQDVNKKNNIAAVNVLNAFINHVRAQRGKAIPAAGADALVASATKIVKLLQ